MGVPEDLGRLGRLLDEGKLTQEEFDQLKAALLAGDSSETAEATASAQKPGWYADPDNPSQWRWWDGSGWTDTTQSTINVFKPGGTSDVPAKTSRGGCLRTVLVLGVLVLAIAYCAGDIAGNEVSETFTNVPGGDNELGGNDPPPSNSYISRYGGQATVYSRIATMTGCTALQAEFDKAAANNDRAEPGTAEHKWTLGYMTAADDRMRDLDCY